MTNTSRAVSLGFGCALLMSAAAQGATVEFYLGGDGDDGFTSSNTVTPTVSDSVYDPSRPITLGDEWQGTETANGQDVTLTVTPMAFTSGASGLAGTFVAGGQTLQGVYLGDNNMDRDARLTQTFSGIGLMNNSQAFTDDQPFQVDGSSGGQFGPGWFDIIALSFDREVTIDYTAFSMFDAVSDSFRLIYDTNGDGQIGTEGDFMTAAFTGAGANPGLFDNLPGLATDVIGIAAVNAEAAWQLHSLQVSWDSSTPPGDDPTPPGSPPTPDPAPIPLPAAGWLLIGAIGGLFAYRRVTAPAPAA